MKLNVLCVAAFAALGAIVPSSYAAPSPQTAKHVLERAATALGGADKIRGIHTLELKGYAQTAYMWGAGGNITSDPDAPQKWQANNALSYNWDFDNNRYQTKFRSNFLFPFAAAFGHAFFLDNRIVDGNVAYNLSEDGKARRMGYSVPGPLETDGAYDRQMWSMTHPISAVRAGLSGRAEASNYRKDGRYELIDLKTETGKLTLAVMAANGLPHHIQWSTGHSNLGKITYTTTFTAYAPFGGVKMPLGAKTTMDWRNTTFRSLFVDGYIVNGAIDSLAAPDSVRNAALPAAEPLTVEKVADRIWRISSGTTVVEFADHMTLFELYGNQALAKATLEIAKTIKPGKPITELIVSHHHFDHTGGIRVGIAEGLTVISQRNNEQILREMAGRKAQGLPDALPNGGKLKFIPVDEHLTLKDKEFSLDLYRVISNNHMADAIFAFDPKSKVMVEGDVGTAAEDWQFWADSYQDNLEHYGLTVEKISPVHTNVFTHDELIEFIREGAKRVSERCAQFTQSRNYLPGCPAFIRRNW
jgi:glyoxylase-like metal-dependent hydrolase (beta-lactamase superfamily II)